MAAGDVSSNIQHQGGTPGVDQWGFYVGQCTDYVATKLGGLPGGLGNAGQWLDNASKFGIGTTSVPSAGDVAVWRPYTNGAFGNGHVAIVEQVFSNGTMKVSEQNWSGGVGVTDTRTIPISDASGFLNTAGKSGSGIGSTGINITNPLNAVGDAITAATNNVVGFGATISLYIIIAVLAIGLVFIGVLIMTKSKQQG